MTMYFFSKRVYKVNEVETMTESDAETEFLRDMVGDVLMYSDMSDFEADFNNGCVKPDKFFAKVYK